MRGQVVEMGATFDGLEAVSPNEFTHRPIGWRRIYAGLVRRATSIASTVRRFSQGKRRRHRHVK
jgi:hypothetical protein